MFRFKLNVSIGEAVLQVREIFEQLPLSRDGQGLGPKGNAPRLESEGGSTAPLCTTGRSLRGDCVVHVA